ncbi:MAG: hypothetical protein R3240_11640, partial [Gammaproteobacteria bacterium]|nr:hypothetical protein [Gammaproteobacteria bacterium]
PNQVPEAVLEYLYKDLLNRLSKQPGLIHKTRSIFVKIKFFDFSQTTIQHATNQFTANDFRELFLTRCREHNKAIRLIGYGVHFNASTPNSSQLELNI